MTNKRTFLMGLGALALTGIAAPAAAQQLSLNAISSYMNGLQTAQGGFTQINADGTLSTGQICYPLNQTPLKIILERNVDFGRARMVTGHTSDGTTTTVTAQDPDNPQYGNIQMVFTANPIELRQWIVTDDVGSQTTVILNDLVSGGRIGDIKFNILAEMRNREN